MVYPASAFGEQNKQDFNNINQHDKPISWRCNDSCISKLRLSPARCE